MGGAGTGVCCAYGQRIIKITRRLTDRYDPMNIREIELTGDIKFSHAVDHNHFMFVTG